MALKSIPKGHLLSSTPLQSPGDSGYFGSGQKRNNANILNSCSPIKESGFKSTPEDIHLMHELPPCIKFEQNLDFENLDKNESQSSIEITNEFSELEFTSPKSADQLEQYKAPRIHRITVQSSSTEALKIPDGQHEIPCYSGCAASTSYSLNSLSADNDISYRLFDYVSNNDSNTEKELCVFSNNQKSEPKGVTFFNKTRVDFVHELFERNCYSIISYILSFLSAKELCIASCVSKQWNKVILSDSEANTRRQNLITERLIFLNGPSKENRKGMKYGPAREPKNVLSDLTNIEKSLNAAMNTKISNSKFDSFMRESRNSKSNLLKCPRCFYASKRINGDNSYLCCRCSYNFCSNCLNPIFTSHTCYRPQVPSIIVGSKKSKRNLKRL